MAAFNEIGDRPPLGDHSDLISSLTDQAHVFIFAYAPRRKTLLAWSRNAKEVLGVKDVAIARDGNLFLRHVHPDDRFLLFTDLEAALRGQGPYRATYRWIRPDTNEVRWLHCRAGLSERDGEAVFEGIIVDLSSEFTGAVGMIAGPDSVGAIFAAFPTTVFTTDRDLRLLRINRSGEGGPGFNFGDPGFRPELFTVGRPILDAFADQVERERYQGVMRQVLAGELHQHSTRVAVAEQVFTLEILPLNERGVISGLLFVVSDVTELVQLERRIAELRKTEGLRLLAAGVSHNFNNALQGIIGQAAVIRNHADKRELVEQASQTIIDIVNRASELSRQLFVFDEGARELLPVDINVATMAAVNRIEDLFAAGINVSAAFGTIPPVLARQEPLIEAVAAVLRNARESMPEGGALAIKTFPVTLGELEVEDLKAGPYVRLVIADEGRGMPAETLQRCVDPFFTTKNRDPATGVGLNGSGLGLSKAFTIVREFKGAIRIDSAPNSGTAVSIFLPADRSRAPAAVQNDVVRAESSPPTILIIDDDLMVLETIRAMLSDLGHPCVTAEDASRGLTLVRNHLASLRLVLLDGLMPGMDGATVLRRIRRIAPGLQVIGFSGAPHHVTEALLEAGATQILRKPVDPGTLRSVVEEALRSRAAA